MRAVLDDRNLTDDNMQGQKWVTVTCDGDTVENIEVSAQEWRYTRPGMAAAIQGWMHWNR